MRCFSCKCKEWQRSRHPATHRLQNEPTALYNRYRNYEAGHSSAHPVTLRAYARATLRCVLVRVCVSFIQFDILNAHSPLPPSGYTTTNGTRLRRASRITAHVPDPCRCSLRPLQVRVRGVLVQDVRKGVLLHRSHADARAYERFWKTSCEWAAASSETMALRADSRETDSPRRQRACGNERRGVRGGEVKAGWG